MRRKNGSIYFCFNLTINFNFIEIDNSNLVELKREENKLKKSRKPNDLRSDKEKEITKRINVYKKNSLVLEDAKGNGFVGKETALTSQYVLLKRTGEEEFTVKSFQKKKTK